MSSNPNERGLVMPLRRGDEGDDIHNWAAIDAMLAGTHSKQNMLTTPGGLAATFAVRPTNVFGVKPLGRSMVVGGTSKHQMRSYVPFGGMWVDVALEFYNDTTSQPATITDIAVASSTSFGVINPTGAWVTDATDITVPVASEAGKIGTARSAWQRLYVVPDSTNPKWGTIFSRSVGTNVRIIGTGDPGLGYAAQASRLKNQMDYQPVTNITDNFANPPSSASGGDDVQFRSHGLLIRPVSSMAAKTVAIFGDSRATGFGSTSGAYGWADRTVEAIQDVTAWQIGLENWGVSGTNSPTFLQRFQSMLEGRHVDVVHWQPASSNDTNAWTQAMVDACYARTVQVAQECARRGIVFVTETMYPSVVADTAAEVVVWDNYNKLIRENFGLVVEFANSDLTDDSAAIPVLQSIYAADPQHRNNIGHAYSATLALPVWRKALGIATPVEAS